VRVTSEARARARDEEEAVTSSDPVDEPTGADDGTPGAGPADDARRAADEPTGKGGRRARRAAARADDDGGNERRGRLSLPLVPTLTVLLVLLLGAGAFLWFTRPSESAVNTGDYAEALQAARSGVVDLTSFDYLTLDDDIEQIRRVATGDLREESVEQLDSRRQEITELQAVVNTEVVGAGVTSVDSDDATAVLVIQSTQESAANPQAQIVRYRIEVSLEKNDEGRWLLSGIKGM
jgi:Mce-associated membrane protein